jgi:DNA-binding transcriptional LysR family regulator
MTGVDMELRQLRYFVTVAEELHFGRAARRLHVVQPAVSQQVARLEREFGLRLLDRTPRTVRLTDAGERLLSEARSVLAAADQAKAVAVQLATSQTRRLRIGTSPGLAPVLERAIDALTTIAPDLRTELDGRLAREQVAAVRRGDLDFAVVRAAVPGPGLQVIELWRDPLHVALPADHPAANQERVRLRQLADLPLRLPSAECDPLFCDLVLAACRQAGFEPRIGRPISTVTNTIVEIGLGAAAWTALYADSQHGPGTRKAVTLPVDPPLTAPVSLVAPASQSPACVDALRTAFVSAAPPAEGH